MHFFFPSPSRLHLKFKISNLYVVQPFRLVNSEASSHAGSVLSFDRSRVDFLYPTGY